MGVERRRNGEQRIRRIRQLLADDSEIVSAEQGCVHDGCVVTLRYPDDPAPQRYWVGDLDTRDENLDVITPGSPLGRALLGTAPGASVPYQSPVGAQEVEVLSVD
jgi:transcription elongation GreA/GreB family factor